MLQAAAVRATLIGAPRAGEARLGAVGFAPGDSPSMTFLISIAEVSMILLGGVLLVMQLLAHELGYRIGLYHRSGERQVDSVGGIVGGMLGLLAFVLAMTLSFANARFDERRQGALAEAGAIGTAWLRAEAIGAPRSDAIARLLQDYVKMRQQFILAERRDAASIDALHDRTDTLQAAMWGQLAGLIREQPGPISASLMTALNDVFDAATKERFAFEMRLPVQLIWLLVAMTALSMGSLGYQLGLKRRPARILIGLLSLMWTTVIVDILDLSAARLGSLRTNPAAYDWTIRSFRGAVVVPPLPPS